MTENQIFELRKARNLTQRALAERVGTSQQQIQRIESGVVTVRLDHAVRIAKALGVELGDAFPSLAKLPKGKRRQKTPNDDLEKELSDSGIDPDPVYWTIKFFICDGRKFFFEVSSSDKERLETIIQGSDKRFLVFNSKDKCVALNRTKIGACQFLFDAFVSDKLEEKDEFEARVHLVSSKEPVIFDVDPDEKTPLDDEFGVQSQMQSLFVDLDGADEDEVVSFCDADDERVYIQTQELLLLEVPLVCCEPALWAKSRDGFSEEESDTRDRSSKESKP